MTDAPVPPISRSHRGQIAHALDHIERIVADGLRHGFFDCSINCEIVNGGKRRLLIRSGRSHKFIIPEEDLPH